MHWFLRFPELASEHGARLDHVTVLVHILMLALFIIWGALFIYMIFRFSQKRNPKADHDGVKSHLSSWGEGAVALAEVILLVGFSIPLYSERVDDLPPAEDSVVVRVIGEQFAWNVHYPGPDGVFGETRVDLVDLQTNPIGLNRDDPAAADDVVTLNQLHLPVGKPALIYLSSKDVIHSFGIPEMRVKMDAIPGMLFPVWFQPIVTTEEMRQRTGDPDFNYEIACAQLCGLGHYRMKGFVTVHTQEEFDAWMAEQQRLKEEAGEVDDFWT
ncbi:MAG: hypothetical protein D6696_01800 [Acidobacteria bacterium]|nr:MAG: hypothetical protein D6696_01800 [Acidobacteriota bacterium]